jgi:AcrR family transcriptional regulator
MPRPRSLTHAQVAAAALEILDEAGPAGLTMRAVARRLGTSTMALYRYVEGREEVEQLVVEQVLGAVDTTRPPADLPWRTQIELMVDRLRETVGAHPSVVPLTLTYRHLSPGSLRWAETVLAILTDAGIEGERRVIALRALLAYVIGAIQLEHLGPLAGQGTTAIAGLPPDAFPHMSETARQASKVDANREFGGGLALLLDGLA